MLLSSFRRIFEQDYPPEFKDLIRTLSVSINNGFEVLYEALNKKVSLKDNIQCTVRDINVIVDSSGEPKSITAFNLETVGAIQGCIVIKAENLTNSNVFPTSGVFISFNQTNNNIIVSNIAGLQANNLYRLRVVAFG